MTTDMTVANTIHEQIGHRAFYMMGAQNLGGTENSLSFKIRGSRFCSHIIVTLTPMDTYTVEFVKVRALKRTSVETCENIYAEDLRPLISSKTGLALHL